MFSATMQIARALAAAAAIALTMWLVLPAQAQTASTRSSFCGVERWKVKTLQDRPAWLLIGPTRKARSAASG